MGLTRELRRYRDFAAPRISLSTFVMAAGTLYTYPENFRAYKILIAAQYSGAKVELAKDFKFGDTNNTDAFLKKFPLGKVPAFEDDTGVTLFESDAIARYVGNATLRGTTGADAAKICQWVEFGNNEIYPSAATWVFPCLGVIQFNKQATEEAKGHVKKALGVLDGHLKTRTFLVGERISQADISVACDLLLLYRYVLDPAFRAVFGNVNRWFLTLLHQPQFKTVIGDFELCQKAAQFDAKKYQELHGKKKEEKPKQEKKQEKKPAKAAEQEEPDASEEALAKEPKPKDPFAACPKSSFVYDEFKRMYSNNETSESIPWFWEHFDKEANSIWYGEYKYPEDLTMIYMSCNLINGMFQRLEKMRKGAFGSVVLFGEDKKSTIAAVWVWQGQDLAFTLSPDWQSDYESYTWKKLDADSPETKKMVDEYFAWEGDFDGKKFNQGKIFK
ncbi:PREDICTED: elongation factor 1-gamma-like [Priapulus caudatus]|uniref:Elongation factor 1-gamma-like n=1 Tax=Priapulus caudatus TaxID=37621 RepID=A0ABM1DYN6_PRICU|nr:PREDICTED: elongation factor 1-gamma-like [Priapulus caudatus]